MDMDINETWNNQLLMQFNDRKTFPGKGGGDRNNTAFGHSNIHRLECTVHIDSAADLFMTVCSRLAGGTGSAQLSRDIVFEKALYQASCKAAIKAGREYSEEHVKWIVAKLMELPDITVCPHGRPVAFELTRSEIEHRFKRS